jgi:GTP cyclohydrolase IA
MRKRRQQRIAVGINEQVLELTDIFPVLNSLHSNHRDLEKMRQGIYLLLRGMGVDVQGDPNYTGTPERVAKMYAEILSPQENNWKTFPATSSDLVLLRNHKVVALCPHHLMPVVLTCYVGYIPNKKTVGLSKLARAVEEHLFRPVLQEDLANAVARRIEEKLEPKGTGVVLTGRHGCMAFRGVESEGDVVTSVMKGVLLLNPAARAEFLQLIGRP